MVMNNLLKSVISGAVLGFISAVSVDLKKWRATPDLAFDWKEALKSWLLGAVTGAVAVITGAQVSGAE
jgi:hypothetical protein